MNAECILSFQTTVVKIFGRNVFGKKKGIQVKWSITLQDQGFNELAHEEFSRIKYLWNIIFVTIENGAWWKKTRLPNFSVGHTDQIPDMTLLSFNTFKHLNLYT